jgi:hypothetical protein
MGKRTRLTSSGSVRLARLARGKGGPVSLVGGEGGPVHLAGGEGGPVHLAGGEGGPVHLAGGEGGPVHLAGGKDGPVCLAGGGPFQLTGGKGGPVCLAGGEGRLVHLTGGQGGQAGMAGGQGRRAGQDPLRRWRGRRHTWPHYRDRLAAGFPPRRGHGRSSGSSHLKVSIFNYIFQMLEQLSVVTVLAFLL